ncbi:hypothetical protein VNI00_017793 [Paramarasmius palmivorus]|uniref:Uncharacterized protein n=1 Tax=Paramarasmius palmivorus TaxID=297713 RepID=A0AAW0B3L5_9AGAR
MSGKLQQNSILSQQPGWFNQLMIALFPFTAVFQYLLVFSEGVIFLTGPAVPLQLVWVPLISTLVLLGCALFLLVHYPPSKIRFAIGMEIHFVCVSIIVALKWVSTTPTFAIVALSTLVLLHLIFPSLYLVCNGEHGFDFGITPIGSLISTVLLALAGVLLALARFMEEVNDLFRGRWMSNEIGGEATPSVLEEDLGHLPVHVAKQLKPPPPTCLILRYNTSNRSIHPTQQQWSSSLSGQFSQLPPFFKLLSSSYKPTKTKTLNYVGNSTPSYHSSARRFYSKSLYILSSSILYPTRSLFGHISI